MSPKNLYDHSFQLQLSLIKMYIYLQPWVWLYECIKSDWVFRIILYTVTLLNLMFYFTKIVIRVLNNILLFLFLTKITRRLLSLIITLCKMFARCIST